MRKGFSLFEILVGIALFGTLVVTINLMLFSSLRNARKAAAVGAITSEVNSALDSMIQVIKYAELVTCGGGATLTVNRINQDVITYSLASGRIASSSGTNTSLLTSSKLDVQDTCPVGMFSCTGTPPRSVNICFDASVATGLDATDMADDGSGAVRFQTQVTLRNFGN